VEALTALVADIASLSQAPAETLTPMVAAVEEALAVRASQQIVRATVATVMAAYRSPDFHAPAEFARMAVEALEDFPAVTLLRLASPKTGIVRRCKWPPSIAELVDWCEQDLAPVRSAVEMACRQIERCRQAEREAQRAIEVAAERARAQAEWEAGAPERERKAAIAAKMAEDLARKARFEDAARKRQQKAHGELVQRLVQWAREKGQDVVERVFMLDEAEVDEGARMELREQGTGFAWLIERLGAKA